jgi:hypothetical protein
MGTYTHCRVHENLKKIYISKTFNLHQSKSISRSHHKTISKKRQGDTITLVYEKLKEIRQKYLIHFTFPFLDMNKSNANN